MELVIVDFRPLVKAKYLKRTGGPGNYKYFYGPGKGGGKKGGFQ